LTTSAYLAIWAEHLSLTRREAAEAIEEGYRAVWLRAEKRLYWPEQHQWLRLIAMSKLRDPVQFWESCSNAQRSPGNLRKKYAN